MASASSAGSRSRNLRVLRTNLTGWAFALPWFLGFAIFTAGPMIVSGVLAFTNWNLVGESQFVGLANWEKMIRDDPLVWQSLRVSAVFAMTSIPLQAVVSLGLAILLNQKIKGLTIYRTIVFLPSLISGVALAMLWRWLFSPDLGLINYLLSFLGVKGPAWLVDLDWALPSLVFTTLWGVGGMVLIYLAALQGVPTALYEAAEVDGARAWNRFRSITLPMISPAIFFQVLMGIINALQEFILGHVMTGGGPMNATLFCVLYLYRLGFEQFRMGYASSVAWVLFFVILVLTVIVLRSSSLWVYYEGMRE